MAYPDIPHLDSPFAITAKGAKVVDQNTPEEILACARNIIACPVGFRLENSRFGSPPLQFGNAPLPMTAVQRAIQRWEPRATADITERALANEQEREIDIRIESDTRT